MLTNLDGKDERHGDKGLLSTGQLVHLPHLVVLPRETGAQRVTNKQR